MKSALLTLLIPLIFYLILPLSGGGFVRYRWSRFRNRILRFTGTPATAFWGRREGFSRRGALWFRSENGSVLLDLQGVYEFYQFVQSRSSVKKLRKGDISDFPEGTEFLIAGESEVTEGVRIFRGTRKDPILLVATDSSSTETLEGLSAAGIGEPLLWNEMTPWSLLAGFVVMLLLVNWSYTGESYRYLLKLVIWESLSPLMLFLPPGGLLVFPAHYLAIRFFRMRAVQIRKRFLLSESVSFFQESNLHALIIGSFSLIFYLIAFTINSLLYFSFYDRLLSPIFQ